MLDTTSVFDLRAAKSSFIHRVHDAIRITKFGSELTKLCHSDGNIPSSTFQLLMEQHNNYLAKILISDQSVQPLNSPESSTSVPAIANEKGELGSKLSTLCHCKGGITAANSKLSLRPTIGSSTNQLNI